MDGVGRTGRTHGGVATEEGTDPRGSVFPWDMTQRLRPELHPARSTTLEVAQHGWDLARATGQSPAFDTEVTQTALTVARMAPAEQVRQQGVFGPEQPCPARQPGEEALVDIAHDVDLVDGHSCGIRH